MSADSVKSAKKLFLAKVELPPLSPRFLSILKYKDVSDYNSTPGLWNGPLCVKAV